MSADTICLREPEARRILELEQAHETLSLKNQQKQELISVYTKIVETFDSVDPGIKHYFMAKLQALVVKLTAPSSILSDRSIISKLKMASPSFLTRSIANLKEQGRSFLHQQTHRPSTKPLLDECQDSSVIQNEFKILEEMQEHKQETIKSSLTTQQEMIAKRLKQRKEKTRRRSAEKAPESIRMPLLNKEELKRMQRDLTKKIKRMTARLSQMESLKAFSSRLVNNPSELESIKNEKCGMIEEEDQDSDKENK